MSYFLIHSVFASAVRRGIFRFAFLLLAGAGFVHAAVPPRYSGWPTVRTWSESETGGSAYSRGITITPAGLIYVANNSGLLEYDGVSWRRIAGLTNRSVYAIASDRVGRVWYAAAGDFGFLAPGPDGQLASHPLEGQLPPAYREIGSVRVLVVQGDEVWFLAVSHNVIVRVDPAGVPHVLPLPEPCYSLFAAGGRVYAMGTAATYLATDETVTADEEATRLFAQQDIRSVSASWPAAEGGTWVMTIRGLRLWAGGSLRLVTSALTRRIASDRFAAGYPLGDGTVALGTEGHGIYIVKSTGETLAHYGENNNFGAEIGTVNGFTLDQENGLWVATMSGISRLQAGSPLALHGQADGLHGNVHAIVSHRGRLLFGTTQGLYEHNPETGRFSALKAGRTMTNALVSTEEGLMIGDRTVRVLHDDGSDETIDTPRWITTDLIRLPRDPDYIVGASEAGLRVYHRTEGHWKLAGTVASDGASTVLSNLVQDGAGWLWAARAHRQLVRLDWRQGVRLDLPPAPVAVAGLPDFADEQANTSLFLLGGQLEVASRLGLYRYDPGQDRFVAETRIDSLDTKAVSRDMFPLADGSIWMRQNDGDHRVGRARPDGPEHWKFSWEPYTGVESVVPFVTYLDQPSSTLWMGYEAVASYDLASPAPPHPPAIARLRQIFTTDRHLVWDGAGPLPAEPFKAQDNSLRFTFAAPSFQPNASGAGRTRYRTQLTGVDHDWSGWTTVPQREYSNLGPGRYTFHVQARDGGGQLGPDATYAFTVLPPWWRTWWAYMLDGIAVAILIGVIVRARTRQLRAQARRLEGIVAERTAQLAQQNVELGRLLQLELDEKIAARLAEERARLHMLRYQLNPHFLFNTLASISGAIPPGRSAARAMVDRLIDFCRLTLHRPDDSDWTTLAEELKLLRAYLDIEHSRWGDLLEIMIEAPAELDPVRLPHFLLLPLVENALKYGRATSPERVGIRISAGLEAEMLVLQVANTGEWIDPKDKKRVASLGVGLENLRERLARYYPRAHSFDMKPEAGWVIVTLRLAAGSEGVRRRQALAEKAVL